MPRLSRRSFLKLSAVFGTATMLQWDVKGAEADLVAPPRAPDEGMPVTALFWLDRKPHPGVMTTGYSMGSGLFPMDLAQWGDSVVARAERFSDEQKPLPILDLSVIAPDASLGSAIQDAFNERRPVEIFLAFRPADSIGSLFRVKSILSYSSGSSFAGWYPARLEALATMKAMTLEHWTQVVMGD